MTCGWRLVFSVATVCSMVLPVSAQTRGSAVPVGPRYTDPANGLSLAQAIDQALAREPSLRAARSQIDVAQGWRLQAELRPNPLVSFEQREEPGGTDRQTIVGIQWPLDLFRKGGRVGVADREIAVAEFAVADRERLLATDVRARYGDVLVAVRDLSILDELVATTEQQRNLLRSRAEEGAVPPLERDLLEVELRRLESERLLQEGRTAAALIELKRVLGLPADEPLMVAETLEGLVSGTSEVKSTADAVWAPDRRADVQEAAARIDLTEARINRAQRDGGLDMSVFASYMRMDAGFPQKAFAPDGSLERVRGLFHYASAGAMVTVPLLNRQQGEIAAERAERESAVAAHEAARLAAQTEIAAARVRDERAHEAVRVYTSGALALARQNLAVVGETYELGRATVFDVLAEQRRYLEMERAYTEALRAAYEAQTDLTRALGDMP